MESSSFYIKEKKYELIYHIKLKKSIFFVNFVM